MTTTRYRVTASMIAAGAALLLTLLFPGLTPWSPAVAAPGDNPAAQSCVAHSYALDAPKESTYAFGPAAVASDDEAVLKAELRERRLCGTDLIGDPTLTAAHYAEWSAANLTSQKVEFAGIDAFASRLAADFPLWESVVTEMEGLESASAFSITDVPAGSPSLYMVPNGTGGVTTNQGVTLSNGTAVTFTNPSGAIVKLRRECGWQNVRETFPGVPPVPSDTPSTPTTPPTTTTTPPPTTPPVCPPGTTGTPPNCLEIKLEVNDPPRPQGVTPQPAGISEPTAPVTPAAPLDPVVAPHSDAGTAVPVQGATPAPAPVPNAAPPVTDPVVAPAPSDPGTPITDPDA